MEPFPKYADAVLTITNLVKAFGANRAVDGVSLQVRKGEGLTNQKEKRWWMQPLQWMTIFYQQPQNSQERAKS